jgi:hemolysin activation/secretion protein
MIVIAVSKCVRNWQVYPLGSRLFPAALVALMTSAGAQTPPTAGSLQQQIERDQQGVQSRPQAQPSGKATPDAPPVGQTVTVRAFKFTGNTLLSSEELSAALGGLLGRPLDFARLQSSAVTTSDYYRSKGWVVQAYLPEQDIGKGEVTIAIVEAVFGQARISGQASKRLDSQTVLDIFARQQQSGQFLSMNALERALLLADDLPGVSVSGTLAAGQQNGQTDLLLQLADEPWLRGSLSADNTGAVSTGTLRSQAAISLSSPSGRGDAANLSLMSAQGTRYGRVGYSLPLGSDGWRIGLNASRLDYELISEAYKSLNASGNSSTTGLELSYPLLRSRTLNVSATLSADKKNYFNVSGGTTSSAYRNVPVSLGLNASSFDALGGGGANALTVVLTEGKLDLNGSPTEASDASSTRTAGAYTKLRYALSRQQQLSTSVSLYGALSGQWAGKNLDSSEKFYLGGSSGVRAYPSSEGGGSLGQMLNVELRWQLPQGMNLVGFYDHGRVTQNVNNDFADAPVVNRFALKGAGLAMGWRHGSGLSLQATYARRIGRNPNAITTGGADQDGTLRRDRFWLTASVAI